MASLDWPFTPNPRSPERFERQNRFGPPPCFGRASPCPGLDRLASGLPPWTPDEHIPRLAPCGVARCRFRYGSPRKVVNLAHEWNSLARFSKRKNGPWSYDLSGPVCLWLSGFRHFSPLVRGTFQLSLTLLLRYRSRDVFRVGC